MDLCQKPTADITDLTNGVTQTTISFKDMEGPPRDCDEMCYTDAALCREKAEPGTQTTACAGAAGVATKMNDARRGCYQKCDCSSLSQSTRVAVPGSEQFFQPYFARSGSKEGNEKINTGPYAEFLAEACRPTGLDEAWAATVSAEAGFEVRCLGASLKLLAVKAYAIRNSGEGMYDIGPAFIIMGKEIKFSDFAEGESFNKDAKADTSAAGASNKGESTSNAMGKTSKNYGSFAIDSCETVVPLIVVPPPFSDGLPDGVKKSSGSTKSGKTNSEKKSSGLDYEYAMSFTIAYVLKLSFGFSTGFAFGIFIEPCAAQSGAMVVGGDPSFSSGIMVEAGISLGVAGAGVGIELTLFELHLPVYVTFRTGNNRNSVFCPQVSKSWEIQLSWYALSGKFYVYVKILFLKFYPFEYYFPGGTDDSGARVNEANWYLQGSFPIMNAAKCMIGTATPPSKLVARRMLTCKLRSKEVREYPFFGSSYFQHIKYSWKDAKSGTCVPTGCGTLQTGFESSRDKTWKPTMKKACNGQGTCYRLTKAQMDQKAAFFNALQLASSATSSNAVLENAPGVGGWGGSCTCPDGSIYWVGDNNDSCGSLACVGGTAGTCNKNANDKWKNRKVTCAGRVWTRNVGKSCQGYANADSTQRTLQQSKTACISNSACLGIMCLTGQTNSCTLRAKTNYIDYSPEDCYTWAPGSSTTAVTPRQGSWENNAMAWSAKSNEESVACKCNADYRDFKCETPINQVLPIDYRDCVMARDLNMWW